MLEMDIPESFGWIVKFVVFVLELNSNSIEMNIIIISDMETISYLSIPGIPNFANLIIYPANQNVSF